MMTAFFTDQPVKCYDDVQKTNRSLYNRFFHLMLDRGVYLAPSAFEALFVSLALTEAEINFNIEQARNSFEQLSISV